MESVLTSITAVISKSKLYVGLYFSIYLYCRQSILTQYACFGLSYFYYDVVVMFIGGYLDEKHENPQRDLHFTHVWSKLYKKKKLIILHHIFLPIFGFPAITVSFFLFQYIRNLVKRKYGCKSKLLLY